MNIPTKIAILKAYDSSRGSDDEIIVAAKAVWNFLDEVIGECQERWFVDRFFSNSAPEDQADLEEYKKRVGYDEKVPRVAVNSLPRNYAYDIRGTGKEAFISLFIYDTETGLHLHFAHNVSEGLLEEIADVLDDIAREKILQAIGGI